ncbi:MAG: RNA methyltransferase [Owenweeksia sp.]|nr:RNA methyltransferase [Owenweeksia sp.]
MLSRSQEKLLRKLTAKKQRWQQELFIAEGRKVIRELLEAGLKPHFLMAEADKGWHRYGAIEVAPAYLSQWSQLEHSDEVLGVFPFPESMNPSGKRVLVLDQIRDPGNMGTLLRTADWFGVHQIYCTLGCVDAYNSKAVQSSMGSIARVQLTYAPADDLLQRLNGHQLLCADAAGRPYREVRPSKKMALVLGNESHGPAEIWRAHAESKHTRAEGSITESLNVAVAGAILMAAWSNE